MSITPVQPTSKFHKWNRNLLMLFPKLPVSNYWAFPILGICHRIHFMFSIAASNFSSWVKSYSWGVFVDPLRKATGHKVRGRQTWSVLVFVGMASLQLTQMLIAYPESHKYKSWINGAPTAVRMVVVWTLWSSPLMGHILLQEYQCQHARSLERMLLTDCRITLNMFYKTPS